MNPGATCDLCGQPHEQETTTNSESGKTWTDTYNQLYVTIEGCYCGFIDTGDEIGIPAHRYVICHDCAVKVSEIFPRLAEAHTHSGVKCACPDYPARQARWDAAYAKQKSDWAAHDKHSILIPDCTFCVDTD